MAKMELEEAKDKAYQLVADNLREWYDIVTFREPVIESSGSGKAEIFRSTFYRDM